MLYTLYILPLRTRLTRTSNAQLRNWAITRRNRRQCFPPSLHHAHEMPMDDICGLTLTQHVTDPPDSQRNFLVVDSKTETAAIEKAFRNYTQERKDIGILLINQHVL